jgi:hypothetical protein
VLAQPDRHLDHHSDLLVVSTAARPDPADLPKYQWGS